MARPIHRAWRRRRVAATVSVISSIFLLGLISQPAAAAAAVVGRLNGTFTVDETVDSVSGIVGERAGDKVTVTWQFTASCATGPCPSTLTRHLTKDGRLLTYPMTPDAGATYTGSESHPDDCVNPDGTLIAANGYSTTSTISIQPTAVNATGDITTWTGRLEATGKATPEAVAAGCPASQESISLLGAVPPPPGPPASTHVTTPDIKLIRFLQVPMSDCTSKVGSLFATGPTRVPDLFGPSKALLACSFLVGATNPDPPSSLAGSGWQKFVASKEFRSFLHIAPYELYCTNGKVSNVLPSRLDSGTSPGWTPVLLAAPRFTRVVYEKGESYSDARYTGDPEVRYSPSNDGVVVTMRTAARIAQVARAGQYKLLGFDAPYIWTVVHLKMDCAGTSQVVVSASTIPRMAVYFDDTRDHMTDQTGDLANFIVSGGTSYHRKGTGNLDPDCTTSTIRSSGPNVVPIDPAMACPLARDNAALGVGPDPGV